MLSWIKQTFSSSSTPPPSVLLQSAAIVSKTTSKSPKTIQAKKAELEVESAVVYRTSKLIMVTANNNNKFYEMKEQSNGTFFVTYGRVGNQGISTSYSIDLWDRKYNEKIRKGYTDQTHLFSTSTTLEEELLLDDPHVQDIMNHLMRCARKSIQYNYNVGADQVTRKQVAEAQMILDNLVARVRIGMRARYFNDKLLTLFQVIPRRMNNVKEHLISTPKTETAIQDVREMLGKEQATLDVMRGQVEINERQQDQPTNTQQALPENLLETMGIQMELVEDDKLIKSIKKMMGKHENQFKRAFKVCNVRTQTAFDQHLAKSKNKETQLFWHGSRNENWLSIMKSGLVLRPANAVITGKMFGYGLYFADKFQKSLNYTSIYGSYWAKGNQNKAYLALYDVHVGKPLQVKKHQPWCGQLTLDNLKARGENYDSLYAKGGADLINNEFIIYDQSQCTIRYIVEVH